MVQTYTSNRFGPLICQTSVPYSSQIVRPVTAWEAYCYPETTISNGLQSNNLKALNFKAWFKATTCPPTTANGAEQPVELNVNSGDSTCFTNLFSQSDVLIKHTCTSGSVARAVLNAAVFGVVLVLAVAMRLV